MFKADQIVESATSEFIRSKDQKFKSNLLEKIYQSITPVNKILK